MKVVWLVTALSGGLMWTAATMASPASESSASTRSARVAPPTKAQDKPVALSEEQLAVVPRVATGVLPCELSHQVSVRAHPVHAGHFAVESGKQRFVMVPVATSTGAIRLEDAARGAVWLQLANKSMLMDQRQGRRLADACMSAEQRSVALALERSPTPHLLESLPASTPQDDIAMK